MFLNLWVEAQHCLIKGCPAPCPVAIRPPPHIFFFNHCIEVSHESHFSSRKLCFVTLRVQRRYVCSTSAFSHQKVGNTFVQKIRVPEKLYEAKKK